MHWREDAEYRPWLRRVIDAGVEGALRRSHAVGQALRDFIYYLATLPGLLLFDWWERFRLADARTRVQNLLMGLPALAAGTAAVFVSAQTSRHSTGALLQHY